MSANIGETRVRDLPRFIAKNVRFFETVGRLASAYRAKYVTCKNAGIRPFFHMGAVCMVLNYMIDYKFHLKYEKNSKYHWTKLLFCDSIYVMWLPLWYNIIIIIIVQVVLLV